VDEQDQVVACLGTAVEAEPVVLQEVIEGLCPRAGVDLEVSCPPGLTVLAEHDLAEQVLSNLAANAAKLFGLTKSEQALLNEVPMRGTGTPMPPTDPLLYRFYELVMVNGPAWKALIEEEFGDGIMSAIDFDMAIERQADPKGDRVKIAMTGKFLPFKYYGATGNAMAYGLKEE